MSEEDLDQVTEFSQGDLNRWSEDGHRIHFALVRDEVLIESVSCPHEGTKARCNQRRDYCVVERFLSVYGAELNVGEVSIDGPVEIAWTPENGDSDLDSEYATVWVTPVKDISYRAMKLALSSDDW